MVYNTKMYVTIIPSIQCTSTAFYQEKKYSNEKKLHWKKQNDDEREFDNNKKLHILPMWQPTIRAKVR